MFITFRKAVTAMLATSICAILMFVFGSSAVYAWTKLMQERANHVAAEKKIAALNLTIASLQERVQDERSGVAELFMRQPLGID